MERETRYRVEFKTDTHDWYRVDEFFTRELAWGAVYSRKPLADLVGVRVIAASTPEAAALSAPEEEYSPHPSGIRHGCPYDYSNPETVRILREERYGIAGTFDCPICGVASPHEHTSLEIAEFRIRSSAPPSEKPRVVITRTASRGSCG